MDILRQISRQTAFEYGKDIQHVSPSRIRILQATPLPNSNLNFKIDDIDKTTLFNRIHHDQLFTKPSPAQPSLNVVFFSNEQWKDIGRDREPRNKVHDIFEYLEIDDALLAYLLSSRSGWYCVAGEDRYSFMIKDYMYMLAWVFFPKTLETRAMIAERSDYEKRSSLKSADGNFHLPGLRAAHLYHPLSLACLCLIDFVFYFDKLMVDELDILGRIEKDTGHGLWVKEKTNTGAYQLPKLMDASREIARIIGIFANLFKSVEITQTITESLNDAEWWRNWYKCYRNDSKSIKYFDECTMSFFSAVGLLKLRMKTTKQSGSVVEERAKAQSNVIAALIRREDARMGRQLAEASKNLAEATKKDSSDMKVIAIMTMAFLPATFFAALFDLPTLAWDQPNVITNNFWVYWAFTVPTTFLVFFMWDILNDRKLFFWFNSLVCGTKGSKESFDNSRTNSEELPGWNI